MKRFAACLVCLMMLVMGVAPPAAAKTVLLINSYHPSYTWMGEHNDAFIKTLGDAATVEVFHMDTKRLPPSQHQHQADKAFELMQRLHPDVVVLSDDNALMLLGNRVLQASTPLVYYGINNNPRFYLDKVYEATGVLERPFLKRSIAYLREIYGQSFQRCLVLFDVSQTAKVIMSELFHDKCQAVFHDVTVDIRLVDDWSKWQHIVRSAKDEGYDAMVLGLYHTVRDEQDNNVASGTVLAWTSANASVPLFAFWADYIGVDKTIGGLVLSARPQGRLAAELVKKVLNGASPSDLPPVTAEQGRFIFSKAALDRWGVVLPPSIEQRSELVE